jgi:hypothetical protein
MGPAVVGGIARSDRRQATNFWIQRDGALATERTTLLGDLNVAGEIESALVAALGAVPAASVSWSSYLQKRIVDTCTKEDRF